MASQEASRLEDGPRSERADRDGGQERGEEEVVAGRDDDLVPRDPKFRQRPFGFAAQAKLSHLEVRGGAAVCE